MAEGLTQRIVKADGQYVWAELVLYPEAPGPPTHVRLTFEERFRVMKGTVSLWIEGDIRTLGEGEEFLVAPGVAHRPFNSGQEEAILGGPGDFRYGLSRDFSVFLMQVYGFFDASTANRQPHRALLQMSRFSPRFDSWIGGLPSCWKRNSSG